MNSLAMVFLVLSLVCGKAVAATVPILMFHQIVLDSEAPAHEAVQVTRFEEHLKMLKANGYTTLTVNELTQKINNKEPLPSKAVVLTFDDGWKSTLRAQKLMDKYNVKSTHYILSGAFNDPEYLSANQVRELALNKNVEIGAHTHSHLVRWEKKLDSLDNESLMGELALSKLLIEHVTKKPVTSFAWPYGYVRIAARNHAIAMGFTSVAETNRESKNGIETSPLQLQRLNVDGACTSEQVRKMIDTGLLDKCK